MPMGKKYWFVDFDDVGFNYRMTDTQAAVGSVQLRKLDSLNARRIEIARRYSEGLARNQGTNLALRSSRKPPRLSRVRPVIRRHIFAKSKEDFMWELYTEKRIKAWSHYMPIHLSAAYRNRGHGPGECPVAEKLFERYLSIPIHPRMTDETVQYVIDSIREIS